MYKRIACLVGKTQSQYIGQVSVGTPPQQIEVILDTGSANFWITSSQCKSEACSMHSSYDHTLSSSYTEVGFEIEVTFGTGAITGFMSCDDFYMGAVKVQGQHFGEITNDCAQPGA